MFWYTKTLQVKNMVLHYQVLNSCHFNSLSFEVALHSFLWFWDSFTSPANKGVTFFKLFILGRHIFEYTVRNYVSRVMRKPALCVHERLKAQISCAVTARLIIAFVFATYTEQKRIVTCIFEVCFLRMCMTFCKFYVKSERYWPSSKWLSRQKLQNLHQFNAGKGPKLKMQFYRAF